MWTHAVRATSASRHRERGSQLHDACERADAAHLHALDRGARAARHGRLTARPRVGVRHRRAARGRQRAGRGHRRGGHDRRRVPAHERHRRRQLLADLRRGSRHAARPLRQRPIGGSGQHRVVRRSGPRRRDPDPRRSRGAHRPGRGRRVVDRARVQSRDDGLAPALARAARRRHRVRAGRLPGLGRAAHATAARARSVRRRRVAGDQARSVAAVSSGCAASRTPRAERSRVHARGDRRGRTRRVLSRRHRPPHRGRDVPSRQPAGT